MPAFLGTASVIKNTLLDQLLLPLSITHPRHNSQAARAPARPRLHPNHSRRDLVHAPRLRCSSSTLVCACGTNLSRFWGFPNRADPCLVCLARRPTRPTPPDVALLLEWPSWLSRPPVAQSSTSVHLQVLQTATVPRAPPAAISAHLRRANQAKQRATLFIGTRTSSTTPSRRTRTRKRNKARHRLATPPRAPSGPFSRKIFFLILVTKSFVVIDNVLNSQQRHLLPQRYSPSPSIASRPTTVRLFQAACFHKLRMIG
jgi:hypothetical protein